VVVKTDVKKVGNVGVAGGELWSKDENGYYYTKDSGLVILYYDDDGNIEDFTFISFDKFESNQGLREVAAFLDSYGIDANHFKKAVASLENYCRTMEKKYNRKSMLIGVGGGSLGLCISILGVIAKSAVFGVGGIVAGGIVAGVGYYYYRQACVWGDWRDGTDNIF
jgi:hypothetical protein